MAYFRRNTYYSHSLFNFGNTLGNWSNLYKNNIYVVNCALSIFKNPSSFSEDTFMNVIRSVEAFHRNTNNSSGEKLRIRITEMIYKLCKNDETIEPPEFFLQYGITNQEGIGEFTQKITNTRNYHSHLDSKSIRQRFEGTDLYYACNVLLTILLSNVLMKIGLQQEVFMHKWTDILGYKQPKNTDLL